MLKSAVIKAIADVVNLGEPEIVSRRLGATIPFQVLNRESVLNILLRLKDEAYALSTLPRAGAIGGGEDAKELAAWRALFSAWASQGLRDLAPEAVEPLWPNNWPQDVAMIALSLHNYATATKPGDGEGRRVDWPRLRGPVWRGLADSTPDGGQTRTAGHRQTQRDRAREVVGEAVIRYRSYDRLLANDLIAHWRWQEATDG